MTSFINNIIYLDFRGIYSPTIVIRIVVDITVRECLFVFGNRDIGCGRQHLVRAFDL